MPPKKKVKLIKGQSTLSFRAPRAEAQERGGEGDQAEERGGVDNEASGAGAGAVAADDCDEGTKSLISPTGNSFTRGTVRFDSEKRRCTVYCVAKMAKTMPWL